MPAILAIVFISVFVVLALVLQASTSGPSQQRKRTIENLDAALATSASGRGEQQIDVRKNETLSAIPVINRWLQNLEIAPRMRLLLRQADLGWTAGRLLLLSAACFAVASYLVHWRTGQALAALIVGFAAAALPLGFVLQTRKRRFDRFEQGLPEALDQMVSSLRAGHSLVAALRLVAFDAPEPIGPEFRVCFEEQNYGLELRDALDNLLTRVPLQDLRITVTAIMIQKESGGNLAEVLDKTAQVVRDRFRMRRQVRTHTAQGRLTGIILSLLPVVLGFALYLVNPETMSVLWTRPAGQKLLYAAAGMTTVGTLIIRKIVNMEV